MVNKWVSAYDIVGFLCNRIQYRRVAYDMTYDIVCDGVGNIVGQSGNKWSKTYDIVGFSYDVVGLTYDIVGYYTI